MVSLMGFFSPGLLHFFLEGVLKGELVEGVIFDEEALYFLSNHFPFCFSIFFIKKELRFHLNSWIYLGSPK